MNSMQENDNRWVPGFPPPPTLSKHDGTKYMYIMHNLAHDLRKRISNDV